MSAKLMPPKKNLLLCLDAFGTLFRPSLPIPITYARTALNHGISIPDDPENPTQLSSSFKSAFKRASTGHPNYGKSTNLGAEKWWANVIQDTFTPFLPPNQTLPPGLTEELLKIYSSRQGYALYTDVIPFFRMLRYAKIHALSYGAPHGLWPWDRTIVGIITNSDDRVPGILSSFGLDMSPSRYGFDDTRPNNKVKLQTKLVTGQRRYMNDVDFTILSYDVGVEKPDRRIFSAAEEMLPATLRGSRSVPSNLTTTVASPSSAEDFEKLYVGDDLTKDVFGAQDAGWSSVLLQRGESDFIQGYGMKVEEKAGKEGEGGNGQKRMVPHIGSLMDLCAWSPGAERRGVTSSSSTVRYFLAKYSPGYDMPPPSTI